MTLKMALLQYFLCACMIIAPNYSSTGTLTYTRVIFIKFFWRLGTVDKLRINRESKHN